jgi:ABC-type glutathione transport system ATPase component
MSNRSRIALKVESLDLKIASKNRQLLKAASFSLQKGEIVALLGPSGSGKTSLLLSIIGLQRKDVSASGKILYHGLNTLIAKEKELNTLRGKEIAMVFQEPVSTLNPVFSVSHQLTDLLRHHQHLGRSQAKDQALNLLVKVGFSQPKQVLLAYPHQLSTGMCQRVALAMALTGNPNLLLADEPTASLDRLSIAKFVELARELKNKGKTILVTSHDLNLINHVADRVLQISNLNISSFSQKTKLLNTTKS